MTQLQFIFDDFADNSFDTANRWTVQTPSAGTYSETGGRLLTPAASSSAPNIVWTRQNWYNIDKGRLAVQMSRSGTTNADTYTYFGVRDWDGKTFTVYARSSDANVQVAANTAGSGTATQTEATIGLGPSLPADTWLGWKFTESTKTFSLAKSSNMTSWTEVWKYVISGTPTFNARQVGLVVGSISFGTVPTFTPSWNDVSYLIDHTELYNKVRVGGAWVNATPKVRVGGAWKRAIPRVRMSSDWYRAE